MVLQALRDGRGGSTLPGAAGATPHGVPSTDLCVPTPAEATHASVSVSNQASSMPQPRTPSPKGTAAAASPPTDAAQQICPPTPHLFMYWLYMKNDVPKPVVRKVRKYQSGASRQKKAS